jgi:16S rRNA (guanine1207-N2)-methyltransferase
LPPRVAEQHALEAAAGVPGERVLCTTVGRAQAALQLAAERPTGRVVGWFLDEHPWRLACDAVEASPSAVPRNLHLVCCGDPPEEPFDLAVLPLSRGGEAELSRDMLQSFWQRLEIGGTLVATVDNPEDRWLREQIAAWFPPPTVDRRGESVAYVARKSGEPRRVRDFRAEFAFRDRGRLIRAVSRPGVFSHRRIDGGARQLLAGAEVLPGERVLDVGCGAGTVALALAARDASVQVHAVDGHARAVECTLAGAALNGLQNVTAERNSTGEFGQDDSFDLAVANPPYYADNRIAELFLSAARRSLRPGGRVLVVAKRPDWYLAAMPAQWNAVAAEPGKNYWLIAGVKP